MSLPVHYHESNAMMAAVLGRTERLQVLTPERLRVVEVVPGYSLVGVNCFEYLRTDIGPYNEVGVTWPVVPAWGLRSLPPVPLLPVLFGRAWPGLGWWLHRLPVTTATACNLGKTVWGFPKFVAAIDFAWSGSKRTCTLAEGGQDILQMTVDTRMAALPRRFAERSYSQLGSDLMETDIEFDVAGMSRLLGLGEFRLDLGPHPVGRELADFIVAGARPLGVQWFPVWRAVLPGPRVAD